MCSSSSLEVRSLSICSYLIAYSGVAGSSYFSHSETVTIFESNDWKSWGKSMLFGVYGIYGDLSLIVLVFFFVQLLTIFSAFDSSFDSNLSTRRDFSLLLFGEERCLVFGPAYLVGCLWIVTLNFDSSWFCSWLFYSFWAMTSSSFISSSWLSSFCFWSIFLSYVISLSKGIWKEFDSYLFVAMSTVVVPLVWLTCFDCVDYFCDDYFLDDYFNFSGLVCEEKSSYSCDSSCSIFEQATSILSSKSDTLCWRMSF